MIDNKDSVQLSEHCFNVCAALETAIRGENLDESRKVALKDLEMCAG